MHKININLHNLKTALIFSIEISRYSSRHGLRTCVPNYGRDPRGGGGGVVESTAPPPLAVRWGQKTRLFLGLMFVTDQIAF